MKNYKKIKLISLYHLILFKVSRKHILQKEIHDFPQIIICLKVRFHLPEDRRIELDHLEKVTLTVQNFGLLEYSYYKSRFLEVCKIEGFE